MTVCKAAALAFSGSVYSSYRIRCNNGWRINRSSRIYDTVEQVGERGTFCPLSFRIRRAGDVSSLSLYFVFGAYAPVGEDAHGTPRTTSLRSIVSSAFGERRAFCPLSFCSASGER